MSVISRFPGPNLYSDHAKPQQVDCNHQVRDGRDGRMPVDDAVHVQWFKEIFGDVVFKVLPGNDLHDPGRNRRACVAIRESRPGFPARPRKSSA